MELITKRQITGVPKKGDRGTGNVKPLQLALTESGFKCTPDDDFGNKTQAALEAFQQMHDYPVKGLVTLETMRDLGLELIEKPAKKSFAPWLDAVKPFNGRGESDSAFVKYMSGMWKTVLGRSLGTIVGSTYAWCGLGVALGLFLSGYTDGLNKSLSLARNYAGFGVAIQYKVQGIPRGAIIHINHNADCKANKSNHVTYSDCDYEPADVVKYGATFNGYGGNQNNKYQTSSFPMKDICEVRWPAKAPLPPLPIVKTDCTAPAAGAGTTR